MNQTAKKLEAGLAKAVTTQVQRVVMLYHGVTPNGANQYFAGQAVTNPLDFKRLWDLGFKPRPPVPVPGGGSSAPPSLERETDQGEELML